MHSCAVCGLQPEVNPGMRLVDPAASIVPLGLPLSLLISARFIWFLVKLFSRIVAQDLCHGGRQKLLQQPTFRTLPQASFAPPGP